MKSRIKYLRSSVYFLILAQLLTSCDIQPTNKSIIHDTILFNDTVLICDTFLGDQSKTLVKLNVDSVKVDSAYDDNNGLRIIDGIPAFVGNKQTDSRWAVEGYPHYAVFYFNGLVSVNKIRFNLYKGDQGYTNHVKFYNFSDLLWEGDVGDTLWNTIHLKFYGSAIFLEVSGPSKKIIGKTNDWTDIGELEFFGYQ